MFQSLDRILRTVAVVALMSGGMAGAALAQTTAPATSASATPTPAKAMAGANKEDQVESRIKDLHAKLHITEAQSKQWDAFVDVMRENAKTIQGLYDERMDNAKSMTAVDDLKSYQKIADAHSDGLKKLVPAFETLYGSFSDPQKKEADALFQKTQQTAKAAK